MLLNLAVFVWVASRYRYKSIPHGLLRAPSMPAPQEQMGLPPPHPHWARAQPVSGTSPFPRVRSPFHTMLLAGSDTTDHMHAGVAGCALNTCQND